MSDARVIARKAKKIPDMSRGCAATVLAVLSGSSTIPPSAAEKFARILPELTLEKRS